jgi:hypothetical protein
MINAGTTMPASHYTHLETAIRDFFAKKGIKVELEPHGSRGPDIESACGTVVGEVKHATELDRDLRSFYWSSWNSDQSFGGKTSSYHIVDDFKKSPSQLSSEAKGWITVVYGQLNHYRRSKGLDEGWLVFEKYSEYKKPLIEALQFLSSERKIKNHSLSEHSSLGFAWISFQS